jgi:hypothetical protein
MGHPMNTPTHFIVVACIPVQQPAYKPTERSARLTRSSGIALGIRKRPHRETVEERVAREAVAFGHVPKR